ncbi:MAG TPA: hypothetical protein VFX56_06380 [Nitrospira sp.]|nr:hypothetical protein [Nitrospira sp.]
MQTADMLDVIGAMASQLKQYAATLPPVVYLSAVPTGVKPTLETVDAYEECVSRVRAQSARTAYKNLNQGLIESLEAFEAGRLLGAVQPLLAVLDQLERMSCDKEIAVGRIDEKRISEYRTVLRKILPGNKPELDEAGRSL